MRMVRTLCSCSSMAVQLMMNRLVEKGVLKLTSKSLDNCSYSILSGVKSAEDQQLNLF